MRMASCVLTGSRTLMAAGLLLLCLGGSLPTVVDGQCPEDRGTAIYEVARHCIAHLIDNEEHTSKGPGLIYLATLQRNCSQFGSLYPCLRTTFASCGQEYIDTMYGQALRMFGLRPGQFGVISVACEGNDVKPSVRKLYQNGRNLTCLEEEEREEVVRCITGLKDEAQQYNLDSLDDNDEYKNILRRWTIATYQCALAPVRGQPACNDAAEDLVVFMVDVSIPAELKNLVSEQDIIKGLASGEKLSIRRSTVGVFGDPHLLIYDMDQVITCSSPEWQIYLSNSVLLIEGQNVHVTPRATTLQQVRINFLNETTKETLVFYDAIQGQLPTVFSNNKATADDDQLKLASNARRVHVLHLQHGYSIFLRKWKKNYFFTLRMANSLFDLSTGLLVTGCKMSEQITRNPPSRRRRDVTSDQCDAACANVTSLEGFDYHSTCLFDCTETGDTGIAVMSKEFSEDVVAIGEADEDLPLGDQPSSASTTLRYVTAAVTLTLWTSLQLKAQ